MGVGCGYPWPHERYKRYGSQALLAMRPSCVWGCKRRTVAKSLLLSSQLEYGETERPANGTPGAWPSKSANSFRQQYLAPDDWSSPEHAVPRLDDSTVSANFEHSEAENVPQQTTAGSASPSSGVAPGSNDETAVPSPAQSRFCGVGNS